MSPQRHPVGLLLAFGGESGCGRLSRDFYACVSNDPVLRPQFPGKSLRCATEETIEAIATERDEDAVVLAARFASRRSVFVGLLARMMQSGRPTLMGFAIACLEKEPRLSESHFAGRTLVHYASGAGCSNVIGVLLRQGANPNVLDHRDHTPLYSVANECSSAAGPEIVSMLVKAGADVNACGGITRATALHMAARRDHVGIARALLEYGAALESKDRKGDTPLQRALNCRKGDVAKLLENSARERSFSPPCNRGPQ